MKRYQKMLTSFFLIFAVSFIGIGYAALTDNLSVTGQAHVEGKPFKGVYIKSVEIANYSNASCSENEYVLPTNHKTTVDASSSGGYVT